MPNLEIHFRLFGQLTTDPPGIHLVPITKSTLDAFVFVTRLQQLLVIKSFIRATRLDFFAGLSYLILYLSDISINDWIFCLFLFASELKPFHKNPYFKKELPKIFPDKELIEIPKDHYQKRVFGFLGERLLNVWVHQSNLKVKSLSNLKI